MNKKNTDKIEMLDRVGAFVADHALNPPIPRVTALVTLINAASAAARSQDSNQDTGTGKYAGAIEERSRIATELRTMMRDVSQIANGLDRELHPGLAEQLRMPNNTYKSLLTRARSFLEVVTPIKAAFVERGLDPDFDPDLGTKIIEFEAATHRRNSGLADQVGGTAAIRATLFVAVAHVRELDTILSVRYRGDSALYAAWKSARRIRRPAPAAATTTPPPSPAA
jgi:hypothetical protein